MLNRRRFSGCGSVWPNWRGRLMTGETDLILKVLRPVARQLAQACTYVLAQGYGTITLRLEDGKVKQVLFESSLMALDCGKGVDRAEH